MNPKPAQPAVCRVCGAPLSGQRLRGLCTRCLARFSLAEEPETLLARELESSGTPETITRHTRFGDYELLEEIAHGGMGIIYRARQISLNRIVAVKMLLGGQFADAVAFQRFRAEAETAARLQHPNIVAIHEIGEHDGQPYFSMDYVVGRNLAELVGEHPLAARRAATYLLKLAHAVQYAHNQGILHRDLKPANILIDEYDEPRITDFGLARRLTGDSNLTLNGQVLGSPNFMPPEQGRGARAAQGTAGDIYSLGAVLYYLLTARPPFAAETFEATLARVLNEDPLPPRHLNPSIPRDLETLCLKCLEKDPARRLTSASALADEFDRFLEGRPLRSRPLGPAGKAARWCRRKPALAMMAATLVVVLAVGLLGVLTQWRRAQRSSVAERVQRQQAEQTLRRLELQRVQDLLAGQNAAAAVASLAALLRQDPNNRAVADWLLAELTHRNWPLPVIEPLSHQDEVHYAEFSPDGTRILTASMDNAVRLWDAVNGKLVAPPLEHERQAVDRAGRDEFLGNLKPVVARFSPDGQRVATGSVDNAARLWDARTGQPLTPPLAHQDWVTSVHFSPDGELLATASRDGTARLWRAKTGEPVRQPLRHEQGVNFIEFARDGRRLLTGSDDRTAWVWEIETGKPVGKPMSHGGIVKAGQFSPDGLRVATASQDATARLWDAATGEPLSPPLHHEHQVVAVAFSPDGCWLATASFDTTVRLWDGLTGAPQGRPLEHGGTVRSVQFSPEGERLVTTSEDKKVRLWDHRASRLAAEPVQHQGAVWCARFSPDGQRVVTASSDRTAQVWDMRPGAALPRFLSATSRARFARWSPDGRWVILGAYSPIVFDSATGRARDFLLRAHAGNAGANFSPDSRQVVVNSDNEDVFLWDLAREECVRYLQQRRGSRSARFSPDGRWILTAAGETGAAVWDALTGQLLHSLPHQPATFVSWAEFSPDDRQVLTVAAQIIRIWDPANGRLKIQWQAHILEITAAHFSRDGRRVATASKDGTARVWDAASGAPVTPPLRHRGAVNQASFSPDGARVITASKDDAARLWDARTGAALGEPLRHEGAVLWACFSPDGERVVTTSEDGTARLWDGRTGDILASPFEHPLFVNHAEFSPDGTQLVTACQARSGWIRDVPSVEALAPAWLTDLAEAIAGQRTGPERITAVVPPTEFLRLKRALADKSGADACARWLKWFLADRAERTVGPCASLTIHESVVMRSHEARLGSSSACPELARLMVIAPTNGLLFARAARIALEDHRSQSDPQLLRRADWLSRRAVASAPAEAAAWWALGECQAAAGNAAGAIQIMETAAQLETASAEFFLAFAGLLERNGRENDALRAYAEAAGLARHQLRFHEKERRHALLARSRVLARQGQTAQSLREHRKAFGIEVPTRDPQTPAGLLDLSAFYNANLDTDWWGMRFLQHNLSTLPRGRLTLGGVEFDVRGAIQLAGGAVGPWGLQYPEAVRGIQVGQVCRRIHFLHAVASGYWPGAKIAVYTIQLDDGERLESPITMGVDIARWDRHPCWDNPGLVAAWEGTSPAGIPVRLFRSTWTNPHPDVAVKQIDFATPEPTYAPFLVAITVE